MANSDRGKPKALRAQNYKEHDDNVKAELSRKQPPIKDYRLIMAQEPVIVEASEHLPGVSSKKGNAKSNRKRSAHAIEPMPIVELVHGNDRVTNSSINVNPQMFLYAQLLPEHDSMDEKELNNQLLGEHAASIFRCKKDKLPQENGYFIFQDLRVKFPGNYRIGFTLFEIVDVPVQTVVNNEVQNDITIAALPCAYVNSKVFEVRNKGSSLPDPKNDTALVHHIEAGGAKLRYRKAQTKKVKADINWGSSLNNVAQGPLQQKIRRQSSKVVGTEGELIEGTVALPQPMFSSVPDMSQTDLFSASGAYHPMTATSPTNYAADGGNMAGGPNFGLAQGSFTFNQPMNQAQTSFDETGYASRFQYPATHFSGSTQASQMMTGYPLSQNMSNEQNPHQPPQYLHSSDYVGQPWQGQQSQDQQRLPGRAQYQNVSQYSNSSEGIYDQANHAAGLIGAGYEEAYQAPHGQYLLPQRGQYPQQGGFYQG